MFLRKDGMNVFQRDDLTGSAEQRRDGVAANKTTATGYKDSVNAHFLTALESAHHPASAEQRRDGVAANKTTATGYKDSVNAHFLTALESAHARHRTRKASTIAARVPASRPSRSAASWRICCPSLHSRSPPTRERAFEVLSRQ